jgi:phosphatidylinositol alpha-mannosyltransferase
MHASLPGGVVSKSFEKLMTPFAKYIAPRLHAITAVSVVSMQTALAYVPDADVDIVPNGINLKTYQRTTENISSRSTKKKTIVYIGRLEKRKGVRFLLDAYALLRQTHSDISLIIAGDGKLRAGLEARVAKYNIPDVSFLGFISEKKKIELLHTASIYCSPALYGESFGIVLLEAMAADCVVVCGNNPGYSSVMKDRGRLSLVNPLSPTDFAQRLEMMVYDDQVRELWTEWAKAYVKQFDYTKIVDQYLAVYKKAIHNYKQSQK